MLCLADLSVTTMGSRSTNPPTGLFGGWPGSTSAFWVGGEDGVRRLRSKNSSVQIPAGARFTTNPGGGGGYGDPRERAVADVVRDVRNAFCTPAEARDIYGVALSDAFEVDAEETRRLREQSGSVEPSAHGATRGDDWMQSVGGRRTLTAEMERQATAVWVEGRL
jgi:N-methylhydantoinase B/oxoprolinase/acetone carboxylase alpha subunit